MRVPLTRQRASVAIGIPWSYVASVVKRLNGTDEEPSGDEVNQQFQAESSRVRAIARNIIMSRDDQDVTVELFTDLTPSVTVLPDGSVVAASGQVAADANVTGLLREYGPQGGLTLLALIALFMMSRLMRGSARQARAGGHTGGSSQGGEREVEETFRESPLGVGLAEPSEGEALFGREIDEASLRGSEMARQVTQFVKDHPATAARLVRRWTDSED